MKKTLGIALIAVLLAPLAFAAGDLAALQTEIQAQYNKMSESYKARNVEAYMSAFAPNFVFKMPFNRVTTSEQLRNVTVKQMETNSMTAETFVVKSIELDGDNVVATVERTAVKPASEGRSASEKTSTYRETWSRTDNGWKLKVRELAELPQK